MKEDIDCVATMQNSAWMFAFVRMVLTQQSPKIYSWIICSPHGTVMAGVGPLIYVYVASISARFKIHSRFFFTVAARLSNFDSCSQPLM